jgi:methylmalonyl-CoA/ethylmalonyl-CoA epimerase
VVLDHVAIAVRSIEDAVERFARLFGYRQATAIVVNTRQQVQVAFLEKAGSLPLKLIAPSGPTSPLVPFVQRGGGLHHLAFRCAEVGAEVDRLSGLGLRILSPPQPGEAFEDHDIAFVYAGLGLNVELVDTDARAGRLP